LAGGPFGKLLEGDTIQVIVDRINLTGRIDLIGHDGQRYAPERGAEVLAARSAHPDLAPDLDLPDDTRLWAALQNACGGAWAGAVYDADTIIGLIEAGQAAQA
jgi:dihydroxyacid dehydratase/phosphogluconate dehydratase